jgi:hypothetical protein
LTWCSSLSTSTLATGSVLASTFVTKRLRKVTMLTPWTWCCNCVLSLYSYYDSYHSSNAAFFRHARCDRPVNTRRRLLTLACLQVLVGPRAPKQEERPV